MASSDDIRKLHLSISQDHIEVEHSLNPSIPKLAAQPINASPLQKETISVLADILRKGWLRTEREFKLLGSQLYNVLFMNALGEENEIGKLLVGVIKSRRGFDEQEKALLRVELEFVEDKNKSNAEIKQLLGWPWEYLYCPDLGNFLSDFTQLVLTRHLSLPDDVRPLYIDKDEELSVLFVLASPDDLEPVQGESILKEFASLSKEKQIKLHTLITQHEKYDKNRKEGDPEAMWQAFRNTVQSKQPHIIHFIGHGRFNDEIGMGEIAFVKKDHTYQWMNEEQIAGTLVGINAPKVRLVFLQACESGMSDNGIADPGPYRAISGIASRLAAQNIPAIVAMQYKVGNGLSSEFAREFYQALLDGEKIEAALQRGRTQILDNSRGWSMSRAFGVPVLYLRGYYSKDYGGLLAPKKSMEAGSGGGQGTSSPGRAPAPPDRPAQSSPNQLICAQCEIANDPDDNVCIKCRAYLRCQHCQAPIKKKEAKYCGKCGQPLQLYPSRPAIVSDAPQFSQAIHR